MVGWFDQFFTLISIWSERSFQFLSTGRALLNAVTEVGQVLFEMHVVG